LREENRLKTISSEPVRELLCARPVEGALDPYPMRRSCPGINHSRGIVVRAQLMHEIFGIFADVKRAGLDVVAGGLLGARRGDPRCG
jgi:hypothetical protein